MTARRGLAAAIAGTLAGAALLLAAASLPWVRVTDRSPAPTTDRPDAFVETVTTYGAAEAAPAATALGLVALAGVAALVGTRGAARRVVGAVLAAAGGAAALTSSTAARDPRGAVDLAGGGAVDVLAAPWVAATGGALVVVAGVLTIVHGPRWSRLGSAYSAPRPDSGGGAGADSADGADDDGADLWDASEDDGR